MARAEFGVLVADDEPAARRGVRQLLAAFPEFTIVGECRNGADVVFLDIQMPGIDGFEVIRRRTPERMPIVVFLTAYDEFALRAFDAQALDYLVKPVSQARFAVTLKRVLRQLRTATPVTREPRLVVATTRGAMLLPLREIDWIEAADNYARVWSSGKSYLLREPLRQLEERIGAYGFVRAHRRALVRIAGIRELATRGNDGVVAILASGVRIPVSRRQRATFAAAVRTRA